jgi:hypothetical protein
LEQNLSVVDGTIISLLVAAVSGGCATVKFVEFNAGSHGTQPSTRFVDYYQNFVVLFFVS